MQRRQSVPTGNSRKKGPSYFTFSPGDQAVGHSGFDKLLRWAEIDFPANPVYAEPQFLPQLRLPETIVEEKLAAHMARAQISSYEPMTAPVGSRKHHHHHHVTFDPSTGVPVEGDSAAPTISPPSSQSRSRNIRTARKSLERQWIALAQQHVRQPTVAGAPNAAVQAGQASASASSSQPPHASSAPQPSTQAAATAQKHN